MNFKTFLITLLALLSLNVLAQEWEALTSGTTFRIFDIHFPDGQNAIGYAACMDGAYDDPGELLKTTDNGDTWTTILPVSGSIDGLETVFFTSVDTGFIAGWNDYIAKTIDGGLTWTELTVSSGNKVFRDIEFWDANNGVALCRTPATWDAFVYVTDDGGDTWTEATGESHGFASLTYSDANTLFAVGAPDQKISKSTDGGLTWALNKTGLPALFLLGVDFDGDYGVTIGQMGDIYYTTDQGDNWTRESISTGDNYESIHVFNSDSTIFGGMNEKMYKTLDGGSTWNVEYDGTGNNHFYCIFFSDNNTGFAGASGGIILRRAAPLSADFFAEAITTCVDVSLQFYDNSIGASSWNWTFEGGTPATSTDQNPTVIYNNPGIFNVELEVSDGSNTESLFIENYITVLEIPGQAGMSEGESDLCTAQYYTYEIDEVPYVEDYEWELNPTAAGILTPNENTAELLVDNDWTGDFTIKVRATNQCDYGEWSDNLDGNVYESPDIYTLEGSGAYCLDGEGVEITLSGSQSEIDYELYLNDEPTGNIVTGTGNEISFGMITDEGYFTAIAGNGNCDVIMDEQILVEILFPPLSPGTPVGPTSICTEPSSNYTSTGSDDASSYVWVLEPEEAGTLIPNELDATIEWNPDFTGIAMLSLYGVNECGEGIPSTALEISVGSPNPVIEGEALVCDWSEDVYEVAENEGSVYTWEVSGGSITDGQGTFMVTVSWEGEGEGVLSISEETADGCEGSSEIFYVTIDDCTAINENALNDLISIDSNPATNHITISSMESITSIHFLSLKGILVDNYQINDLNANINISHLKPGIYILRFIINNKIITKKLVVE